MVPVCGPTYGERTMIASILSYSLTILFLLCGIHGLYSFAGTAERKFSGFGFLVPVGFLFAAFVCAKAGGI